MKPFLAAAALCALAGAPAPAAAIYLSRSGDTATLSGSFAPGDDKVFADFLGPGPAPRVLYRNSYGGEIGSAIGIGRLVRKARLTTAMRAESEVCDSACTMVFIAGVKRHYIHGERVAEGIGSFTGLGFHPAHRRGNRIRPSIKSEEASDLVNRFYAEMGAPQAADLVARAMINSVFRPNGATSLRMKIATSLAEP